MAQSEDYYVVLEVSRTATASEIKKSFRRLALSYHPDRNDAPEAEARFKLINEAYATLSDPERRKRYDRYGQSESVSDPFQGGVNAHDLKDIFGEEIFNNLFASLFGARPQATPPSQLRAQLQLTLEDVLAGGEHDIIVNRQGRCDICQGQGGKSRCPRCQGQGQIQVKQGFFVLPRPCTDCGGSGRDPRTSCRPCSGRGVKLMKATARVNVPVGVVDGQQLRVRGAGHVSPHGGASGDLIVEIVLSPHKIFERQERDLIAYLEAPFDVMTLGGDLTVPLLEGGEAKVKVPSGLQPGKALRLRGKGLLNHGESKRGDLLVYLEIYVPKVLTAAERELLVALRKLRTDQEDTYSGSRMVNPQDKDELTVTQRMRSWFGREH